MKKRELLALREELEALENRTLAPYAVRSSKSGGREFREQPDQTRTAFQHDRDRIVHSKAFRRLSGKTQVFVATYGDHFRDRLTHSLEVAQVARGIARNLRLNEDLAESIALAHDLGHTPFGHAGEETLDAIMRQFGSHFEHNEQSKRIVEKLEKQFPEFDGLNLMHEVRSGLAKHQTAFDQRHKKISGKTLEAQVVDIADEIAYHNHDLDDGLRSGLFTLRQLQKLELWNAAQRILEKRFGNIKNVMVFRLRAVSAIISLMIQDVVSTTVERLGAEKIARLDQVLASPHNIVSFSPHMKRQTNELRSFLWRRMYQSPRVLTLSRRGQKILERVYWHFYRGPKLMPRHFYERIDVEDPLEVVVKDYVAGMTDQYAEEIICAAPNAKMTTRK